MLFIFRSTVFTTGLAIFSMLFGAGNLMYPIKAGVDSGNHFVSGIGGFLLTAVLLPVVGLVAIILFNGDYQDFFYRLGRIPGFLFILFCFFTIGPFFAMPRIVAVTHTMLDPFFPISIPISAFAVLFCFITFLATYRENKVIDILGHVISPLLLISLGTILIKGITQPQPLGNVSATGWEIFKQQAELGYAHLDLLGGIFFASIVLTILKNTMLNHNDYNVKTLALTGMKSGLVGCFLLGIVYTGMALLGAYHGTNLGHPNVAQLFSLVSRRVVGVKGAFLIATAVAMACFSTIVALAAVVAEYIQRDLLQNKIKYTTALAATLLLTIPFSCYGLDDILNFYTPIINICYPIIITITIANILHKTIGLNMIKTPVVIVFFISLYYNTLWIRTLVTSLLHMIFG